MKVYDNLRSYLTAKEERRLDELATEKQNLFTQAQDTIAYQRDIAKIKLQDSLKGTADSLQFISGTADQPAGFFNKATGTFTKIDGLSTPATTAADKAETQAMKTVSSIDSILASTALDSTFGMMNYLNRTIPGTEAYVLASEVNNLVQNLALAARGQLKGQGTVSDFEGKMLKEAQTALKMNMNPDQARRELAKVRGALRTSSGLTTYVKITDQSGVSQIIEADQAGISQAVKDGLTVEYQ
jgi:hypothetical protein